MVEDDIELEFDTFGYFLLDRYAEDDLYVEVRSKDENIQLGFHLTDGNLANIIEEIELVLSSTSPDDLDPREYDSLEYVELRGDGDGPYRLDMNLGIAVGNVGLSFSTRKDVERLLDPLKKMAN